MSAGDDPSDTVPPPAGEEDAYSATTKVGVMPAELMAKLRAEGLLPEESEERRLARLQQQRPSAKTTLRSVPTVPPVSSDSSPPSLSSDRPPSLNSDSPPSLNSDCAPPLGADDAKIITTAPPPPPEEATLVRRPPSSQRPQAPPLQPASESTDDSPLVEVMSTESSMPPNAVGPDPGAVVETPIAFASPPAALVVPVEDAPQAISASGDEQARALADRGKGSKARVFVAMLVLVVLALVVALMRRRG